MDMAVRGRLFCYTDICNMTQRVTFYIDGFNFYYGYSLTQLLTFDIWLCWLLGDIPDWGSKEKINSNIKFIYIIIYINYIIHNSHYNWECKCQKWVSCKWVTWHLLKKLQLFWKIIREIFGSFKKNSYLCNTVAKTTSSS